MTKEQIFEERSILIACVCVMAFWAIKALSPQPHLLV